MSAQNRNGVLTGVLDLLLCGVALLLLSPSSGCPGFGERNLHRKPLRQYKLPALHAALGLGFSPDGREILVHTYRLDETDGKGYLHFFDARSGKRLGMTSQPSWVGAFGYFDNGKKLLTAASKNGGVHVFTGKDWEMVATIQGPAVQEIKIHPDGKHAAVVTLATGALQLWDLEDSKKSVQFQLPTEHNGVDLDMQVKSLDISPDGKQLAVALNEPRVEFFDLKTGKATSTIAVDSGHFFSLCYSPDGKQIATTFANLKEQMVIRIWDVASKKLLRSCRSNAMQHGVPFFRYTPDGNYILAMAHANPYDPPRILIWAAATGQLVETLVSGGGGGGTFELSPDGATLLSGDGEHVYAWDFAAMRQEFEARPENQQ